MTAQENGPRRGTTQRNFSLPEDLVPPVDEMLTMVSPRDKWVVYTSAVLLLMEKGEEELREMFARVYAAKQMGNLRPLIDAAREKAAGKCAERLDPAPTRITHIKGGKVTHPKS